MPLSYIDLQDPTAAERRAELIPLGARHRTAATGGLSFSDVGSLAADPARGIRMLLEYPPVVQRGSSTSWQAGACRPVAQDHRCSPHDTSSRMPWPGILFSPSALGLFLVLSATCRRTQSWRVQNCSRKVSMRLGGATLGKMDGSVLPKASPCSSSSSTDWVSGA